jgi:hypothetical protein
MLGNDPLQQRVIHMVIPRPVGVDDQDGAASAAPDSRSAYT